MLTIARFRLDNLWRTWCGNPLITTLFLASSHMSHELSFQTCAAILYSSISGSWNKNIPKFQVDTEASPTKTASKSSNLKNIETARLARSKKWIMGAISGGSLCVDRILFLNGQVWKGHFSSRSFSTEPGFCDVASNPQQKKNGQQQLTPKRKSFFSRHFTDKRPTWGYFASTWAATTRLTLVKWNCRGSSVDNDTHNPLAT